MIAMALICRPKLLIADEPTAALDVTIQAQILDLMLELMKKINTSIILITHDLGVVAEVCARLTSCMPERSSKRAMSSAYLITRLIPTHGDCFGRYQG